MNMGPKQPRGLTPCSRYSFMVSWERRCRSLANRVWSSFILGWRADMAFIWRLCFIVRGTIKARTITVKITMLSPKLLKKMEYNSTRLLIIGRMMTRFQMSPMASTV